MLPKRFDVLVGVVIGSAVERLPRCFRRAVVAVASRVVSTLPGGGWTCLAAFIDE